MAFSYAKGPLRETTGIPASAFSKGHPLMYTSASSLSSIAELIPSGTLICGFAKADSTESLNNQVPYVVALHGTTYWSDMTIGSQVTAGEARDLEFTSGEFYVSTSQTTPIVWIEPQGGSADVVDSATSRVLVVVDPTYLIYRQQA